MAVIYAIQKGWIKMGYDGSQPQQAGGEAQARGK
jgi:hypothetical protein